MARTLKSDKLLFWATLLLVGISVVMVYSASAVQALAKYEQSGYVLLRQSTWAVLGIILMLVVMRIDYHEYRRPAVIWSLLAVTVLALLAVFLFPPRNHTQRWITFSTISIQPSELAKLAAILFVAALLERRMHRVNDVAYALAPTALVTLGLAALIVREPDFGTAAVLVLVVTSIVFAAGLSYRYLLGAGLFFAPVALALILGSSYRRRRLFAFLDPWSDPLGDNFQLIQSLIAIGSGGPFGTGLMAGIQKLYYLPEAHTDFIYAVAGEELGIFGTGLILLCFATMGWRGLRTSLLAPDRFGSLLALGLTMMVLLQALVNMSVALGLLPTKGIPLPFVSNGGSSLVINLVAMGILLNISQQSSPTAAAATAAA
ncbi:MAG TPA: putative lipid II flippase FtsW [Vicinamibacterales bacterium]|nr:putative lipid II flippase FtsW [Vicinamibacterales bacterium]